MGQMDITSPKKIRYNRVIGDSKVPIPVLGRNIMKLDMKKTFILGLGFFGINLLWPVYNAFVPIMLEQYTKKRPL